MSAGWPAARVCTILRHVRAVALVMAMVLIGTVARAQDPVPPVPVPMPGGPPPSADSVPALEPPNGTLLRADTLTYRLAIARGGAITPLGTRTVSVSEATVGGAPAWLVAEGRTGTVVETSDSLLLTRADLSPLRWAAVNGRSQLGVSFTSDSAFGAMQSYQGRASFAVAVPRGTLVTPGMLERIIELLPLRLGYRVSTTLLFVDMGTPRRATAELAVEREEPLDRGDGAADDSWVVAVRAGALEERLWVSKATSRVVRTEQATSSGLLTATLEPR